MSFPISCLLASAFAGHAPNRDLLVSADWLAQHQGDRHLVLLHVAREQADYDKGHIPGARFVSARSLWVTTGPGVELPPVAQIDSLFESLGISDDSRIIFYGEAWTAPRAFLALDFIGLGDRSAMLNGGLSAWTASGRQLSTDPPAQVLTGSIAPKVNPDIVADADWIKSHLDDPKVALVDARTPAEYAGTTEIERLPRYGHIPGARNLPWLETFTMPWAADSGRATPLIDTDRLAAQLAEAGVTEGKQVLTYCTVGLRASHLYFIARYLGYRPKIYDGSMRDWAPRTALPVVGPAPKPVESAPPERRFNASVDWLHHNFEHAVVLHVDRNRQSYDSSHIETAQFVPMSAFVVERDGLSTELPTVAHLDSLLESLGIGDDGKKIVLYGDVLATARLFFTLDYLGLADRVLMLDGGFKLWRDGGHPVTAMATAAPARANLTVTPRPETVVDAAWITAHAKDRSAIPIDARKAEEYAGSVPEDGVPRPGHIPGAANLDWSRLFAEGRLKSDSELEALFRSAGAAPDRTTIAYCRVGTRASALYYAAKVIGFPVVLYDGSMMDWSRRSELPVATGAAPARP